MHDDSSRWEEINPSPFAHERDGLRELAKYLPEEDPFHVWSNVEFVATDGSINEVDALVLIRSGLYILELKHWQGDLGGDGTQWVRRKPNGRLTPEDNPYILANRKAKRLAGLIRLYASKQGKKPTGVFVGAAVFLHATDFHSTLDEIGRQHVYGLDGHESGLPSLKDFLVATPAKREHIVDARRGREWVELVRGAKIRPSVTNRRIGQLILYPTLFAEGAGWQDFLAGHSLKTDLVRRVRFYLTSRATEEDLPTITRAAEREFRLLQGIHHPGIAHPVDLVDHAFGPAVIFDHVKDAVRLDQWLVEHPNQTLAQKLQLVQDLAEIVDYAHSRRLSHRALHPHAIFVSADRGPERLLITDWQTARRLAGATQVSRLGSTDNGIGLELFFDDEIRRYQAPEAATHAHVPGVQLDVFALGAIAYRILTGTAPADNAEQLVTAVRNQGLNLAATVDGMPAELVNLVYRATHGDPQQRPASVTEFRRALDAVWDEITAPAPELVTDPLEAKKGDTLKGGFTVVRRLGSGATAIALLVTRDDSELVLKVARDEQHAERLAAEADALGKLPHWQVAKLIEGPVPVSGHTTLVLESAGPATLVEELQRGRLALEMLGRYGRDLLDIVAFLDGQGVWHRDLKPANLAARPRPKDKQPHLCVFDFSLAATPADQLNAGTPPYLDPFLGPPKRPRYDNAAERFAAAVTLYEMATGTLPGWGENANPAAIADEVTLDPAAFDSVIADQLVEFFAKALARDAADRFTTIEEMTDAWRDMFRELPEAAPASGPFAAGIALDTALEATELTARARSALQRLGVHTVGELLDYEPSKLTKAPGVPDATRKEILAQARTWRALLDPEREPADRTQVPRGIEAVAKTLLVKPTARNANELAAMGVALGQIPSSEGTYLNWPSQALAARATGQNQPQISAWLKKYAKRWLTSDAVTSVRDEIVTLLDMRGGVMSAAELAEALAAARGSCTPEPGRLPQTIGVVRAAVEAELSRGGDARVAIRRSRNSDTVLVGREPDDVTAETTSSDTLEYAAALGQCAARLCTADPLLSRQRAVEALRAIGAPDGMPALNDQRLLQLAAAASSNTAALSAQGQLYPVGMAAGRALRLAAGTLTGPRVPADVVRSRVKARFPVAEALPGRPKLDRLLEQYGLQWDGATQTYTRSVSQTSMTASRLIATSTPLSGPAAVDEAAGRLAAAIDGSGFLAVLTPLRMLDTTRRALLIRHRLTEVNVTTVLLEQLRALAFPWEVIVAADNGNPDDADFRGLTDLVRHHVVPAIAAALEAPTPILITDAAPLARYGQMRLLQQLTDPTRPRPAARLLLVPANHPDLPMLDNVQLPLTSKSSQLLWLPRVVIEPTAERSPAR